VRAHPAQGCSAQCPRRTLFRQWAHSRRKEHVSLGAMPPSPKELRHGSRRLVCAPPEADRDARDPRSGRAFRGKMALATFAETKVARGCRGRSAPRFLLQLSPKAIQH
jgi:hypothetical protein